MAEFEQMKRIEVAMKAAGNNKTLRVPSIKGAELIEEKVEQEKAS